ncbi:carboxypeptidase-like regulatory domain-containing protein [Candidatus Woesearchaeota archaeon]|nr:carboxypeptidase-like regulatory domain-containing protein [Candidatus Woesearchaeota archaeon]
MGLKNTLLSIILFSSLSYAQTKVVKQGSFVKDIKPKLVVVDESNSPLPNVNVLYSDLSGTVTNLDGELFFENVDSLYSLKFSYVGFNSLEKNVLVKDGLVSPDTVFLDKSAYELSDVSVIGTKDFLEIIPFKGRDVISEDVLRKTSLVTGNSLTDKIFMLTTGASKSLGSTWLYGGDASDIYKVYEGIPLTDKGFFNNDGLYLGENLETKLNIFDTPPNKLGSLLGFLDVNSNISEVNKYFLNLDQFRFQFSSVGKLDFFKDDYFNFSVEKNIAGLWNLANIKPDKNQLILGYKYKDENKLFEVHSLFNKTQLSLENLPNDPFQKYWQSGVSLSYSNFDESSFEKFQFVYNVMSEDSRFKDGFLVDKYVTKKLFYEFQSKNFLGFYDFGFELHHDEMNIFFDIEDDKSINDFVLPYSSAFISKKIMPTYFFIMQEYNDKNFNLAFGLNALLDLNYLKKGFAFAPYFGLSFKDDFIYSFNISRRVKSLDFEPSITGAIPNNYESLKFLKSDKFSFSIESKDDFSFGTRLSYVVFRDQHKSEFSYDFLDFFNEDAYLRLDSLISYLGSSDLANEIINDSKERYVNNRNRHIFAVDLWLKKNSDFYLGTTISKAKESGVFGSSTIYDKDISMIFKGYYNLVLFGEKNSSNLSLSSFFQYATGYPYTPRLGKASIVDELNAENESIMLSRYLSRETMRYLNNERSVQLDRNSSRMPNLLSTSLSLNYDFKIETGFKGSASIYVLNPHLLFPRTSKNTTQIYYTYDGNKLVRKEGKAAGIIGGFSFQLRF